jgi:hypothetical protein
MDSFWAVQAGRSKYVAHESEAKYVVFEVSEAFTVVCGNIKLTRMRLHEGMHCCFEDDDKTLGGVPEELVDATFFELAGRHKDHNASSFTVFSEVDAIVYGIAIYDFRRLHGEEFVSGFPASEGGFMAKEGWDEVPSAGFQLRPWQFPMGSWKKRLQAGVLLDIPFLQGLYGSIALKPDRTAPL